MRDAACLAVVGALLLSMAGRGAAEPSRPALDLERMARADRLIEEAVERGEMPGAVLLVGGSEGTVYRKAYGNRAVEPDEVPMTTDTIFDLASLSKVVGCATSVMMLIEQGRLNLSDRVSRHIPAFGEAGKEDVTVEDLLLHRGGLAPANPASHYEDGPERALEVIHAMEPAYAPGTRFRYSDLGYIVLGELVRVIDGRPLDAFAREEIFEPMDMRDTAYNPPASWKDRIAPTERREGRWMVGEVHDPRAYLLGGVAGHAGLFSTADDLATWCRMILKYGTHDGRRILSEMAVREMIRQRCLPEGHGCRGYGFDINTGYSSARGNLFEAGSTFGHTGFTGTMFWIDPHHDAFMILLTNRVHPDGTGKVIDLRRRVATVVAAAIIEPPSERYAPAPERSPARLASAVGRPAARSPSAPPARVLCGIDVLKRDGFNLLNDRRVAVISNHTGLDLEGNRTVDLLVTAPNVEVVAILAPEHGFYGELDERVADTVDEKTRLKVYSLYGDTRRPTPDMLEGVDTIVFDIQDIGARFYTYISTLGNAMEEAAKLGIEVVVLDRPNPIRGLQVDGPRADEKYFGFTAFRDLPVTHGMTVGELARLFKGEYGVDCELTVVPVEGWRRSMWWDETGLMWVNPSPNMRNLTQAVLYPAIGMIEFSNVSVGRGTDQPFEFLGAPWVDGRQLAAALNNAALPGLRFVPITFMPESSRFKNERCEGVYILVTDRERIEPVRSGLTIAWHLRRLFGGAFQVDRVNRLLMSDRLLTALKETDDPDRLPELWAEDVESFEAVRRAYLLY